MTIDHEDLIAETVRALASNQWTSGWGVESLAERLCDALEDTTRLAQETTARLREAEAVIEEVRANAVELLDADDDSYDGSLSAIWAVELIDAYKTTKTETTDRENGSER